MTDQVMRDSWTLRTKDRERQGLPEVFNDWMLYKVVRDENDNLVVVADRARSNVVHEPAYEPLWQGDTGREPTEWERRQAA